MTNGRRTACACAVAMLAFGSCGRDGGAASVEATTTSTSPAASPATYALPFGLEQVEGAVPIGRPAIYDQVGLVSAGRPITARTLEAAYRIHEEPADVFRRWVDQVRTLHTGQVTVRRGDDTGDLVSEDPVSTRGPQPWLVASGSSFLGADGGPTGDRVDLQLWSTTGDPVLLVKIERYGEGGPSATIDDEVADVSKPAVDVEVTDRRAGDVLLQEQSDVIHVPAGSTPLSPTIPVWGGTGGSYTVLAASDGGGAVRALLQEAVDQEVEGNVVGPETTRVGGSTIIRASYVIPAGGWGFEVVSVRSSEDLTATVYVRSFAD